MPAAGYFDGPGALVSRPLSEHALLASSEPQEISGFELR